MSKTTNRQVGFLRTTAGIKLMGGKYSIHLSYEEIAELNAFSASGARASSPKIELNWVRASLRATSLRELQAELDRRTTAEPYAMRESADDE